MIPRLTSRIASVALAGVFLFVLVGLTAAHRAMTRAEGSQATLDAEVSAGLAESFLHIHAEALSSFHGVFLDPRDTTTSSPAADHRRFDVLLTALGAHVSGFRQVWVADAGGRVLVDSAIGGPARGPRPTPRAGARSAGLDALLARARSSGHTVLSTPPPALADRDTTDRAVTMVEPLYIDGRLIGFAGAAISVDALLQQIADRPDARRMRLALLAGGDTIASRTTRHSTPELLLAAAGRRYATATIELPGGGQWQTLVTHGSSGPIRTALWSLGLLTLAALALGVMHERRQSRRIAERSAELERLSAELLRANRAKSEFLANVSHELRTPLNAIVGFADLLRDGVYGELAPRQAGPVQRIEASANHLRHLVDQVLDLAKMAAGRLEVHTEILDLRPFVFDVATEVESLVSEKQLALSLAVGASLPRVRTDPTHLRQILVNLLGNAVKFTEHGAIAVRARLVGPPDKIPAWRGLRGGGYGTTGSSPTIAPGGPPPAAETTSGRAVAFGALDTLARQSPKPDALWVALQVADTGIGISAADSARIFDEFEQVNAAGRGDSMARGTGLGLSISRRLARLLGGDLTIESEVGKGSTFTLWLPVDPADLRG